MNSSLKLMISAVVAAGAAGGVALAQTNPNLSTDGTSYASGSLNNDSAIQPVYKRAKDSTANSSSNASNASNASNSTVNSAPDATSTDTSSTDNSAMAPRADRN